MEAGLPAERVALVTGVAGGICSAVAAELSRDGFVVAGTDRVRPANGIPCLARFDAADITSESEVRQTVEAVADNFGRLDAVVVGAGIASQSELLSISPAELQQMVAVNLFGSFYTVQAAYRVMLRGGGGRIVVISSLAAAVGGVFAGPHYVASKAAVEGLVRSVAKSGAAHQILVNAVAPGVTATEMTAEFGYRDDQFPLGRVAQPADIVGAIAFLCGDRAGYITGITLHVNGGTHFGC
jgi:3-oxoacyl-[acyl-carrier protein] reductase